MRWILIAGSLLALHAFADQAVSTDNKTAAQIQAEFDQQRATRQSALAGPAAVAQATVQRNDETIRRDPDRTTTRSDGVIAVVLVVFAYFFPSLVAGVRHHHNATAILVLNIFLGWTVLGWIVALVWSCTAVAKPAKAAARN